MELHNSNSDRYKDVELDIELAKDFIRIDLIQDNWRNKINSKPFRYKGILQVILIKTGYASFIKSKEQLKVEEKQLMVIPSELMHQITFSNECTGYIITSSHVVLDSLFSEKENSSISTIYKELTSEKVTLLESEDVGYIKTLFNKLHKDFLLSQPNKFGNIRSYLALILTFLARDLIRNDDEIHFNKEKDTSHYTRFLEIIKRNQTVDRKLTDYAKELSITTTHLNRICKNTVNKSASEVVQDYIVKEAKRYLRFTSYSMADIAFLLRFSNPNYFSRYMKSNTGHAPIYFRSSKKS